MPDYHFSPMSVYNSYSMNKVRLAKYANTVVLIELYEILRKNRIKFMTFVLTYIVMFFNTMQYVSCILQYI